MNGRLWMLMVAVTLSMAAVTMGFGDDEKVEADAKLKAELQAEAVPATQVGDVEALAEMEVIRAEQLRQRDLLWRKLHGKRIDLKCDETKLEEVIGQIKKKAEVNLVCHWQALANVGIAPDLPVTLELKQVTIAEALDQLLILVSGELGGMATVEWSMTGSLVTVSSQERLMAQTVVRSYDVGPLVDEIQALQRAKDALRKPAIFQSFNDHPTLQPRGEVMKGLANTIRMTIAATSWLIAGGQTSTLAVQEPDHLVIRAPEMVHREVAQLLLELQADSNPQTMVAWENMNRRHTVNIAKRPLREAFDELAKRWDVDLLVNWRALEQIGAKPDQLVSLEVELVTGETAFSLIAEQAADDILIRFRDGHVYITSSEQWARQKMKLIEGHLKNEARMRKEVK